MENAEIRVNGTIPVDFDINSRYEICLRKDIVRSEFLHGIWYGDSPFHHVLPVTLLQIFLFLLSSRLTYFLLRPLRTPKFVCSVLAGIILGPSILGRNKKLKNLLFPPIQAELLMFMATLSVAYYIFIVTMKMEAVSNFKTALRTWRFGTIPFLSSFWVMSGLFFFLFPNLSSQLDTMQPVRMLLCVTTSITTFPVMSENLLELNLITSELGQIASSSTILNEIAHWVFIAISTVFKHKKVKYTIGYLCSYVGYVCFCFFVIKPAMMMIARKATPGKPLKQAYVVIIQIGVLAMAVVSSILGLSFLQGPLIVGLVMPHGPPLATTVVERTEGMITHFLLPLFFCYLGLSIDVLELQTWGTVFKIQLIIIAGLLTKIIACMLISLSYDIRLKHGLVLGLMLNFKGIIDVIIFARMRALKIVDEQLFAHMVFSVIGITAIVSPLIEILYKPLTRPETFSRSPTSTTIRSIQNTSRNSELCIMSCVHKEGEVRSMIALLESFNPSHANPLCVYVIHLVELSGQSTPVLRRVDISKKKSLTYPTTSHIVRAFDNYARNSGEGSITLVPCINVAPYKSMHESICNFAQDRSVPFIIIPFHQNDQAHGSGGFAATIRNLNMNFLAYSMCTVGILVDRHSHLRVSSTSGLTSLHIAIFFMGGPDDREALALGMRMAERESTSIIIFRFVAQINEEKKESEEEYEDRRMDENLIDEFMAMKIGKVKVEYHEINVEGSEVFETIRRLEGNYDLVMVGRKQTIEIEGFNDEEVLVNFLDNADMLGLFGDMLASREFCDGMVPVLVIQSGGGSKIKGLGRKGSSVGGSQSSFSSRFW